MKPGVIRGGGAWLLGAWVLAAALIAASRAPAAETHRRVKETSDVYVLPPPDVIAKTNHAYRPGTRRPYGVLEWPAMRRLADRLDPSYRD